MIEQAIEKASDTKALKIGPDAIAYTGTIFNELFPGKRAIIVADMNTWAAAGERVCAALSEQGISSEPPFILEDSDLYAEWSYLEKVQARLENTDAIAVAVGSGVINDLVKLASHRIGRRYIIVGTAASMDGYTAFGASITKDGNKDTFECKAPSGVIIEPEICAAAPKEMAASGYADLIAKVPAGADWMLAEAVGADRIDDFAFSLVQDPLRDSISDPQGIYNGETDPTGKLAEGLIMSGFAMQAAQSSRPASGLEHQFSHYWDMEGLCFNGKHVSHGFKVGIGTLLSTACYEFLLPLDLEGIDIEACTGRWPDKEAMKKEIETVFAGKPGHLARGMKEGLGKYISSDRLASELSTIKEQWPELREQLRKQIMSFDEVFENLKMAGAPYTPEMIGLTTKDLKTTFRALPYMRNRYTIIDLIYRCGLMEKAEEALFGKDGRWSVTDE